MVAFLYGLSAYLVFLPTLLYAIGFVGNWVVPRSIDAPVGEQGARAWIGNALLLGVFAVQHSLMARPAFKRWWTRLVPELLERSTYVLVSSLLLIALFRFWQPLGGELWNAGSGAVARALQALSLLGWGFALVSTLLLDHLELFGVKQVWLQRQGRPARPAGFRTPLFYRWVRHPIYLGFLLAFWSTPRMTLGHLFFGLLTTGYILVGVRLEERDLAARHPEYEAYRSRVPMLLPLPKRR